MVMLGTKWLRDTARRSERGAYAVRQKDDLPIHDIYGRE